MLQLEDVNRIICTVTTCRSTGNKPIGECIKKREQKLLNLQEVYQFIAVLASSAFFTRKSVNNILPLGRNVKGYVHVFLLIQDRWSLWSPQASYDRRRHRNCFQTGPAQTFPKK